MVTTGIFNFTQAGNNVSHAQVIPVAYLVVHLFFKWGIITFPRLTSKSWTPAMFPFQPLEMLRLPVCATMAALSVAYFKSLMQPNIHLHEDILVIMASMAHQVCATAEHFYSSSCG